MTVFKYPAHTFHIVCGLLYGKGRFASYTMGGQTDKTQINKRRPLRIWCHLYVYMTQIACTDRTRRSSWLVMAILVYTNICIWRRRIQMCVGGHKEVINISCSVHTQPNQRTTWTLMYLCCLTTAYLESSAKRALCAQCHVCFLKHIVFPSRSNTFIRSGPQLDENE